VYKHWFLHLNKIHRYKSNIKFYLFLLNN